jgi:hypothetical protein
MNSASLDILQAYGMIGGSLFEIALMTPVYAAIWTLAWVASEQLATRAPSRA